MAALATGRTLADLMLRGSTTVADAASLRPGRFADGRAKAFPARALQRHA